MPSLTPEQAAVHLQGIQFAPEHIASDVRLWDGGLTIPKLAYCRTPHDVRSAGIAVITVPLGSSGQQTVGNMKASGAPFVITLGGRSDWEVWRQSFSTAPRMIGSGETRRLGGFLREYSSILNPDAIYRAKLWGRVEAKEQQPEMLDLSYLPLVERGLGEKVASLLEECFEHLLGELGWSYGKKEGEGMSQRQAKWLVQAPFWLLAAKILRDKQVQSFKNIKLTDFSGTFGKLAKHYQSRKSEPSPVTVAKYQEKALTEVAERIGRFHSLQLMSTEALGHIYESSIINKETRKRWGTHSTPVWLIDYMLARLRSLIADMHWTKRRVFEPAVGHGGFLVAGLRVLDELLPASERPNRKTYLRDRLSGVDIDDFSQEVARLALTLADVPNANGWDLDCLNMYEGDELESRISQADIVLANPPFERFDASERPVGSLVNKAAEVFRQTLIHLPPGGVFGFVLPETFLSSEEGVETRRRMLTSFDVHEITVFADKVFEFGQPESAIIIGQKRISGSHTISIRFQRVREKQVEAFKQTYEPSTSTEVLQSALAATDEADCHVPTLPELWSFLNERPKLGRVVHVGQGFSFKGAKDPTLPANTIRQSKTKFAGATEGYVSVKDVEHTHGAPDVWWFNLAKKVIGRPRSGTAKSNSQVLLNYAPTSRGEWRLKAILDPDGHPVTSRILVVRPEAAKPSLNVLWGLLNSPIANAYAFCVSSKRDVEAGEMRDMPLPGNLAETDLLHLDQAVATYLRAAREFDKQRAVGAFLSKDDLLRPLAPDVQTPEEAEERLMHLHWRVDAEILRLYNLPAELERQLLDLFTGVERRGVPFKQTEYFPAHFTDLQRLEDLLAITADWEKTSARKTELIEKKIRREASEAELGELARLKRLTEARGELFAPLPLPQLEAMKVRLKSKGQWEGES
ncbi:MAG: SAM-dependent DNA methyltransferase [Verrucomicrobiales bacterium]|nr:SAM-dependent DNA methyltransferase [Verrucomicrobiales bacterium]